MECCLIHEKISRSSTVPFLDPFHRQASYAPELLEFWSDMVENDKGYAQRLKTDYRELREKRGKSARQAARLTCLESGSVSGASRPARCSSWHCSMPLSVV